MALLKISAFVGDQPGGQSAPRVDHPDYSPAQLSQPSQPSPTARTAPLEGVNSDGLMTVGPTEGQKAVTGCDLLQVRFEGKHLVVPGPRILEAIARAILDRKKKTEERAANIEYHADNPRAEAERLGWDSLLQADEGSAVTPLELWTGECPLCGSTTFWRHLRRGSPWICGVCVHPEHEPQEVVWRAERSFDGDTNLFPEAASVLPARWQARPERQVSGLQMSPPSTSAADVGPWMCPTCRGTEWWRPHPLGAWYCAVCMPLGRVQAQWEKAARA